MEPEKIGRTRLKGHLAIFTASVLWGAMSPIAKDVMLSGVIPPLALSAIRITGGMLVFWMAGLFLPKDIVDDGRISRKDIWKILLMSVFIISLNQGLYIVGIGFTTPFEATVMTTMTPVFTMLLAAIFLSLPMTVMKVSGVALGLAGALLLAFGSRGETTEIAKAPLVGNLMCLGAQICAAVYYTFFRDIISRYQPFTLLKWLFLAGTVTWLPFTWTSLQSIRFELINATLIVQLAYIIIFPTFLSYLLMVYSQQRLKPTSVSMYSYIQPLTAAVIASLMGLTAFTVANIAESIMIFGGVAMVAFATDKKKV